MISSSAPIIDIHDVIVAKCGEIVAVADTANINLQTTFSNHVALIPRIIFVLKNKIIKSEEELAASKKKKNAKPSEITAIEARIALLNAELTESEKTINALSHLPYGIPAQEQKELSFTEKAYYYAYPVEKILATKRDFLVALNNDIDSAKHVHDSLQKLSGLLTKHEYSEEKVSDLSVKELPELDTKVRAFVSKLTSRKEGDNSDIIFQELTFIRTTFHYLKAHHVPKFNYDESSQNANGTKTPDRKSGKRTPPTSTSKRASGNATSPAPLSHTASPLQSGLDHKNEPNSIRLAFSADDNGHVSNPPSSSTLPVQQTQQDDKSPSPISTPNPAVSNGDAHIIDINSDNDDSTHREEEKEKEKEIDPSDFRNSENSQSFHPYGDPEDDFVVHGSTGDDSQQHSDNTNETPEIPSDVIQNTTPPPSSQSPSSPMQNNDNADDGKENNSTTVENATPSPTHSPVDNQLRNQVPPPPLSYSPALSSQTHTTASSSSPDDKKRENATPPSSPSPSQAAPSDTVDSTPIPTAAQKRSEQLKDPQLRIDVVNGRNFYYDCLKPFPTIHPFIHALLLIDDKAKFAEYVKSFKTTDTYRICKALIPAIKSDDGQAHPIDQFVKAQRLLRFDCAMYPEATLLPPSFTPATPAASTSETSPTTTTPSPSTIPGTSPVPPSSPPPLTLDTSLPSNSNNSGNTSPSDTVDPGLWVEKVSEFKAKALHIMTMCKGKIIKIARDKQIHTHGKINKFFEVAMDSKVTEAELLAIIQNDEALTPVFGLLKYFAHVRDLKNFTWNFESLSDEEKRSFVNFGVTDIPQFNNRKTLIEFFQKYPANKELLKQLMDIDIDNFGSLPATPAAHSRGTAEQSKFTEIKKVATAIVICNKLIHWHGTYKQNEIANRRILEQKQLEEDAKLDALADKSFKTIHESDSRSHLQSGRLESSSITDANNRVSSYSTATTPATLQVNRAPVRKGLWTRAKEFCSRNKGTITGIAIFLGMCALCVLSAGHFVPDLSGLLSWGAAGGAMAGTGVVAIGGGRLYDRYRSDNTSYLPLDEQNPPLRPWVTPKKAHESHQGTSTPLKRLGKSSGYNTPPSPTDGGGSLDQKESALGGRGNPFAAPTSASYGNRGNNPSSPPLQQNPALQLSGQVDHYVPRRLSYNNIDDSK